MILMLWQTVEIIQHDKVGIGLRVKMSPYKSMHNPYFTTTYWVSTRVYTITNFTTTESIVHTLLHVYIQY